MARIPPESARVWLLQRVGAPFWRRLAVMIALNLLITVLLTTLSADYDFLATLETCNAIGFSIWGVFELLRALSRDRLPLIVRAAIGVPVGFVVGSKIATWVGTADLISEVAQDPTHGWRVLAGGLMVAVFATSFFIFYWRAEAYRADLQSERRRAAEALQAETSAKLALLQAQIEPHFLFNTLANAQSVIESDPRTAKSILEHLNQYLRVSLGRTRRSSGTLAEEISLIDALLAIATLRLGDRLRYSIAVPGDLKEAQLPPLLLQPLVENALKHGIEPSLSGGEIRVQARREEDSLCLRVTDTGVGMNTSAPEGVGLENVRGRLARLYGDRGRLAIFRHEPRGVVAEIRMPLEPV
jgi:signal transduction histidine kinase